MNEPNTGRMLSAAPPPTQEITVRALVVEINSRPQYRREHKNPSCGYTEKVEYGVYLESCTLFEPISGESIENVPCAGLELMRAGRPGERIVVELTVRRIVPAAPIDVNTPTGSSLPAGVELEPDGWDTCGTCNGKGTVFENHAEGGRTRTCGQCKGRGRAPHGGMGCV